MLGTIVHIENHRHLRIEAINAQRRKIRFGIENQPVGAILDRAIDKKERLHAPVRVSPGMAQLGPTLVRVLHFQANCHTTGRGSSRRVEYVSRNGAHVCVQFTNRSRTCE